MKIVIIGGGVAGLAFGIMMSKKGHQIVINEKSEQIPLKGNAFMMHGEGLAILKKLFNDNIKQIPGGTINHFILKRPDGTEVKHIKMDDWQCIRRVDLVSRLIKYIDGDNIKYNRIFSHFLYKNEKVVAAVFENGDIEFGDIFIGADGCNSAVRQELFGETIFSPVEVQEILGILKNKTIAQSLKNVFTKYQSAEKGISFGCIPFSEDEIIWFSQFDVRLCSSPLKTKEALKKFSTSVLKDFPAEVTKILEATDFSNSYLWNTKDFESLAHFHKKNVVLIGDAAHLALPFTSAGTTNALYDAQQLAEQLDKENDIEIAFQKYYDARINSVKEHLTLGRNLKYAFLHPETVNDDEIVIPLIKKGTVEPLEPKRKKIEILYFTDPICSTCWSIQPHLRKLKLNYGKELTLNYIMGGLLPSWNNFNRGGIQQSSDVIPHWDEVAKLTGMPIDSSVWKNDPLESSFPPSIAFKAAQMQDVDRAIIFLRRMNELVFLEATNISIDTVLKKAAFDSGLDVARLFRDIKNKAAHQFYDDLALTKELNIETLPTFIIKSNGIEEMQLKGYQDFNSIEQAILKLHPSILKNKKRVQPLEIFRAFPTLTQKEFSFLTDTSPQVSERIIHQMLNKKYITQKGMQSNSKFYALAS